MCLAAGLHPDPLRELQRSLRTPSLNRGRGPTSKWKGGKRRLRDRGKGEKGRGGKKMGMVRGRVASSLFNFWLRACQLKV